MSHFVTISVRVTLEEAAALAQAAKDAKRSMSAQCALVLGEFIKEVQNKQIELPLELPLGE